MLYGKSFEEHIGDIPSEMELTQRQLEYLEDLGEFLSERSREDGND